MTGLVFYSTPVKEYCFIKATDTTVVHFTVVGKNLGLKTSHIINDLKNECIKEKV
jgi:hypothetical protein